MSGDFWLDAAIGALLIVWLWRRIDELLFLWLQHRKARRSRGER